MARVSDGGTGDLFPGGTPVMEESGRISMRSESERRASLFSEEQLEQLREALKPPAVERPYFGELADAWLASIRPLRVAPENEERLSRALRPLYLETEDTLTAEMVDDLLLRLADGWGESTVNKARATGVRIVEFATARGRWEAPNPFEAAHRLSEEKRVYETLTTAELWRVQLRLSPARRREFRVAVHLGLRPGELLALQKRDVDLPGGSIQVRRSRDRDTTKTNRPRVVPIVDAVLDDLAEAITSSPSALVFPRPDGTKQRNDTKLTRILRTAMAAAGVGITGATYKCRRWGCHTEPIELPAPIVHHDCARCGFALWPVPTVRPVRWVDLRHICATLSIEAGAHEVVVAKALGHSIKGVTGSIYAHPSLEVMRRELSRWSVPRHNAVAQ